MKEYEYLVAVEPTYNQLFKYVENENWEIYEFRLPEVILRRQKW